MKIREFDILFYRHQQDLLHTIRLWPPWLFDEARFCGGYHTWFRAKTYDVHHRRFRDYVKETTVVMDLLQLNRNHTVLDMGCGTGAFCLHAAPLVNMIYAVDISKAMIKYTQRKARKGGIANITFCHGGLLTYTHKAEPVDAVVCVMVLHHLPDFWKLVALQRLKGLLKPGGRLYLFDVVYSFDVSDYRRYLPLWMQTIDRQAGWQMAQEAAVHVKEEYSTCDWIMEGLLAKAGFTVDKISYENDMTAGYLCTSQS